jgi:dsRNA-specific ribonuclease
MSFKDFIKSLLSNYCNLNDDTIKLLTCDVNMTEFKSAFTTKYVDPINNYEMYEYTGDYVLNYNIVKYILRRFPMFSNPLLLRFFDKIKQLSVSKTNFSNFARKLGFEKFINFSENDQREDIIKDLLENTFEAFAGCVERLVDKYSPLPEANIGSAVIYQFVKKNFDEDKNLFSSFKFLDIVDPITIAKELIKNRKRGDVVYNCQNKGEGRVKRWICIVSLIGNDKKSIQFGPEYSDDKDGKEAKKKVAKKLVDYAYRSGIIKRTDFTEIEDIIGSCGVRDKLANILFRFDQLYSNCDYKKFDKKTQIYKDFNSVANTILLSEQKICELYDTFMSITEELMRINNCKADNEWKNIYPQFAEDANKYYNYYLVIKSKQKLIETLDEKCKDQVRNGLADLDKVFSPMFFKPINKYTSFMSKIKELVSKEESEVCYYKFAKTTLSSL